MYLTRSLESYMNLEEDAREYCRRSYEYEVSQEVWFRNDIDMAKGLRSWTPYSYGGVGRLERAQDAFQKLQEAVNAGLEVAEAEFPIGTEIYYPYMDNHGFWSRPVLTVVHYQKNLPTKSGSMPGVVLLHTSIDFGESPFSNRGSKLHRGSSRYRDSIIHDFLTTTDADGFQAGLPKEFREVVTPLKLKVPAYVDGEEVVDEVEANFFLPSIEEIGFNQQGRERTAVWSFINLYRDWWYHERRQKTCPWFFWVKDYVGVGIEKGAFCWLRSACKNYDSLVWVMQSNGKIGVRDACFPCITYAPACAIVKKS